MIKGSLLCSIPNVKRFRADPLGNKSPPKHVIWRKNGVAPSKKCGLQRWQENL